MPDGTPYRSAPDWKALVHERLRPLDLPAQQRQEVVAELAAHLEDLYEEQLRNGRTDSGACDQALSEVAHWPTLVHDIQHVKQREEIMNARTKQLWLPGLVSLATAMILLMVLIQISLQPRFVGRSPLYLVFLPWLVLLPLCSATGAYLSRRGGGYLWVRLAAGLFPTLVLLILGAILTVTRLVAFAHPIWWYSSLAVTLGIVLPSVALLLGALPFLGRQQPGS